MPQRESSPRSRWMCVLVWACLISMALASQVDAASATGQKAPSGATAQKKAQTPPPQGRWREMASMTTPRSGHTATLLQDGRVLVTGGVNATGILSSVELYDPSAHDGRGGWTRVAPLKVRRKDHVAVLLSNGKVLVAGGTSEQIAHGRAVLPTAVEIFDPTANGHKGVWITAASLQLGRTRPGATVLPSGQILITGGRNSEGDVVAEGEIYDPYANQRRGLSRLTTSNLYLTGAEDQALLPNGTVLLVGNKWGAGVEGEGCENPAYRYNNPVENHGDEDEDWTAIGKVNLCGQTVSLLPDGTVMAVGVKQSLEPPYARSPIAYYYDPTRLPGEESAWRQAPIPPHGRERHTATVLLDGRVLLVGGLRLDEENGTIETANLFDRTRGPDGTWVEAGRMSAARTSHTATLLRNGMVLVVGGQICCDHASAYASAEIYEPGRK